MSRKNYNNTPRLFEVEEYVSYKRKDTQSYDDFIKKFRPINGSDECYTPIPVFECVYNYVRELFPQFNNMENLRPFKPNGNFLKENYTNKIVIDNPPFTILSNIIQYYKLNNIKFWLFAPTLTIMHYYKKCDIVLTKLNIKYTNGANINTSFVTNMFGDDRIVLDGILTRKINSLSPLPKKNKNLHPYILSGARLQKWVTFDKVITIKREDTLPIISSKYKIFGNGVYVREGVLPAISADISKLSEAEKLYLESNKFTPIC